jgi:UDP-N-acetylmuramoyl-tripeptide--D-alanyl-D-alanine ligase
LFSWIKLEHLAKWTGGSWSDTSALSQNVKAISTDSRSIAPGQVFAAIKGPTFDGHAYIDDVAKQGAIAAIVEHATPSKLPQLVVKDTSRALVAIGEALRDAFEGPVLAITGSAGKSSTKEMVADLLGAHTVRSPKSFNNLWGVPRTLFLLQDDTKNLVLEMGMNALGEIKEICHHFKPTRGLITNIGDAHMGKMGGKEKIYEAKKELFDALAKRPTAEVALNVDDKWIRKAYDVAFAGKNPTTVTYSGLGAPADVRVTHREMDPVTGELTLGLDIRGTKATIPFALFGLHQAHNIAAASAAALLFGLTPKEILARLPDLKSTTMRGELVPLSDGKTLIDESYNSNPSALAASLASVAQLDPTRRRVLVLGEMRELGDFSADLHAQTGRVLVDLYKEKKFPFVLVGVGNGFLPFLAAVEKELPGIPCVAVSDTTHAVERLKSLTLPGDIILVKGSRGIELESVVTWLKS